MSLPQRVFLGAPEAVSCPQCKGIIPQRTLAIPALHPLLSTSSRTVAMRFLKGLVLRGPGLEVKQVSTSGFAALLHQLPITNFFFRALGICLHFLLYLLPFAASYWGDSSSFSRTKATELGQASGQGCCLARVTLRLCCSVSNSGPFRSLGLVF